MGRDDAADDVGAEVGPGGGVLGHELAGPVRVGALALHDLDEAGGVGVADDIGDDVGAVLEGGLGGEQLGGLGPPAVLLGTVAVAAGGFLGLEAGQGDEAAVLGDPGGRAEPAGGTGGQVPRPLVERGVGPLGVRDLSLDDLNEHLDPPWRKPAPVAPDDTPNAGHASGGPPCSVVGSARSAGP